MKKKCSVMCVVCTIAVVCALFSACLEKKDTDITIYGLKGPSGVGIIQLFEKPPEINGWTVHLEALSDSQLMAARLISGEAKIGMLPPNVAAKIAATADTDAKKIQVAAVTGQGMLSLLSCDSSVATIDDLKGKVIFVAGQGAVPEYVFRKILQAHNLDPDTDLTLDFSLAYPEIAQSLIAGRIVNALLPEPFATMALAGNKNSRSQDAMQIELRTVGDIQSEWADANNFTAAANRNSGNYPLTVLVVNADFAKKNPALVRAVTKAVGDSINWVAANPADAGLLVEKHKLGLKAPIVTASIPKANYIFADALEARPQLEALFNAFLAFQPDSIGGKLPDDAFYFK